MKKNKKYTFKDGVPVKKNMRLFGIIAIVLGIGLAVLSWFILPDSVAFQAINGAKNYLPKFMTMLLPTFLSIGGALFTLISNYNSLATKGLIVSAIGDFLFIMHICLTFLP